MMKYMPSYSSAAYKNTRSVSKNTGIFNSVIYLKRSGGQN